ncbi:MAG: radical SAM protein [archaeon]
MQNQIVISPKNPKLKVVLVRGPIVMAKGAQNNEATPAIAYAYLSSFLKKKGYDVVMVDAIGEGLDVIWPLKKYKGFFCQGLKFREIIERIPNNADVIAFSAMFSGEWPVLRDLIYEIRKRFPKQLFVAGGEHITALTEYSLKDCKAIDVCVRGEGEIPFLELLEKFHKTKDFRGSPGTAYIEKRKYVENGTTVNARMKDIKDLPWPDWPDGYLEKFWECGKSYGRATKRDMPFLLSRGCPFRCAFCSNSRMYGPIYVLRDIDDVVAELKYYIKKYKITAVQLYDLTAITKRTWTIDFCNRLIKEKIKLIWSTPSGTRSEALDEEVLKLLKKVGLRYLVYAPETGSEKTLKRIRKSISLDTLTKSLLMAKKIGLTCRANLIIGFPGETWKDVFATLSYGTKLAIRGVDEVPYYIYSPYPGTEFFEELYENRQILLNDKYFFSLTSLNGDYLAVNKALSFNVSIHPRALGMVRVLFVMLNYGLSYLLYPTRIIRLFRSLTSKETATVFEHRLKDVLKRTFSKKTNS